ncbi:neo-calmodulin [Eurytemora carolleeae]|uniref:neo-calmodulin n=1 Tax=Eurytemora carolleeae TaxID=1294199 RepID=UPI000C766882|nr:neo-calmodulin [Eurytemora carolleeae]|eukprot:XP_023345972.1 neo-calmodulin-like [Eurytemora affinis]
MNEKLPRRDIHPSPGSQLKIPKEDLEAYKGAFDAFDWNHSGKISYSSLQSAMRRAGQNPTDIEVSDLINNIHDGSGYLEFQIFCKILTDRARDMDLEVGYKECFRVFSKDEEGCIPAEEIKFVLMHLPGKITYKEIDEMIATVDRNEDWKISYSEFRVMLGAIPLVLTDPIKKNKRQEPEKVDLHTFTKNYEEKTETKP